MVRRYEHATKRMTLVIVLRRVTRGESGVLSPGHRHMFPGGDIRDVGDERADGHGNGDVDDRYRDVGYDAENDSHRRHVRGSRHITPKMANTLRDTFTVRVAMDSAARQGTKTVLISSASRHMLSHRGASPSVDSRTLCPAHQYLALGGGCSLRSRR